MNNHMSQISNHLKVLNKEPENKECLEKTIVSIDRQIQWLQKIRNTLERKMHEN